MDFKEQIFAPAWTRTRDREEDCVTYIRWADKPRQLFWERHYL